jgi:branched-subunit amino acid ABC-type transport system permease component
MASLPLISYQLINGLIWGLIVALLATGLNLIYGLLNIVNVAQGAFYMLGAYLAWLSWRPSSSAPLRYFWNERSFGRSSTTMI